MTSNDRLDCLIAALDQGGLDALDAFVTALETKSKQECFSGLSVGVRQSTDSVGESLSSRVAGCEVGRKHSDERA